MPKTPEADLWLPVAYKRLGNLQIALELHGGMFSTLQKILA
jgi:hypothetical protein